MSPPPVTGFDLLDMDDLGARGRRRLSGTDPGDHPESDRESEHGDDAPPQWTSHDVASSKTALLHWIAPVLRCCFPACSRAFLPDLSSLTRQSKAIWPVYYVS
jgi:hypothetical protein